MSASAEFLSTAANSQALICPNESSSLLPAASPASPTIAAFPTSSTNAISHIGAGGSQVGEASNGTTSTTGSAALSNYGYGLNTGGMYGGMGSMYGGMGSMYGGMGGMYGGMGSMYGGMGGMYGGMGGMGGMYGMGMGMPEDFQRNQMTFMLVGRLLEMCGMFAGVIQMTFGSTLQFMTNYIGMSQQYNQLQSGMYMDASGNWVQAPPEALKYAASSRNGNSRRRNSSLKNRNGGRWWVSTLRRLAFILLAVFLVKKLNARLAARQLTNCYSDIQAF